MTVEQLTELARHVADGLRNYDEQDWLVMDTGALRLATAVLALLDDDGTACGMPLPAAKTVTWGVTHQRGPFPVVTFPRDIDGDWDARDARSFARALLRCADEAEEAAG